MEKSDSPKPFHPQYRGIETRLMEGDLVEFLVEMGGARSKQDVSDYAQCAAAQYALIRGYGFARQVRTNVTEEGGVWRGDADLHHLVRLARGLRTDRRRSCRCRTAASREYRRFEVRSAWRLATFHTGFGLFLTMLGECLLIVVPLLLWRWPSFCMPTARSGPPCRCARVPTSSAPSGLLQSFADFLKYITKEVVVPAGADRLGVLPGAAAVLRPAGDRLGGDPVRRRLGDVATSTSPSCTSSPSPRSRSMA